jgi:hypothetical protein
MMRRRAFQAAKAHIAIVIRQVVNKEQNREDTRIFRRVWSTLSVHLGTF